MITVQEATRIVLEANISLPNEIVPLHLSLGRVLREDLVADRDFPPFDRVAMDGIAIHFDAFNSGQRAFPVEGIQAAGTPQQVLQKRENCMEVMTGAVLPANADTVIRYEDLEMKDGLAQIVIEKVARGQNIHTKAADRKTGDTILKAGVKISPAEVGVAATVGEPELRVARQPKIAIVSTGDELVDVEQTPLPHQIRKSNVHTMAAALSRWGFPSYLFHLPDDKAAMAATLSMLLQNHDALLLSGGVSMGKFDYLPAVLEELGVVKLFHKVSQRPGKPFWFGRRENGAVVFAFPGNPVSGYMCLHRYFQPWLWESLGLPAFEERYAVLADDFFFKPNLTYFLQVKLQFGNDGRTVAVPVEGGGSGDLANLVDADAFLELPMERQAFKRGEVFPLFNYR
ncbi:MAG: molybdopterin molybdotransferase MoeA [Lewinellaceae bacterium]|nr:molybdopterin molybdotransferase MoeA [Lewinellaceae bacterium]